MKINKAFLIITATIAGLAILASLIFFKEKPEVVVVSNLDQPISAQYTDSSFFLSAIKQNETKPSAEIISGLIIPHHLLARDIIASAFASASAGKYETIVLLSPDHFEAGKTEVSITERDFSTVFGTIASDKKITSQLKKLPFLSEGDFFYREHGLQAELPFIRYYFPSAKIVALTFKPTVSQDKLDQVISILEKTLPSNSLIIESTDFSHYLTPAKAALKDSESIAVINSEDTEKVFGLRQPENLDSKAALYIQATLQRDFYKNKPTILEHKNSQDYTTEIVSSSTSYLAVAYSPEIEINAPLPITESGDAEYIFVGDIMLSRYIGEMMAKRQNYNFPFEKIKGDLVDADLVFGNLESPISGKGESAGNPYPFRAEPQVVSGLKEAGFTALSIANNHSFDYKLPAFVDTMANLKQAGIAYTGGGANFNEAHSGALIKTNGIKTTILAYTDLLPKSKAATETSAGIAYLDEAQMVKDIKVAKEKSDLVIVSFHWGQEYQTKSNAHQQKIATAAIKAGADLIVGHHPHVPQEISQIDGVTVAYSLGNFIFDQNFSPETKTGLILKVKIENKKIVHVESQTISFTNNYQPYIVQK